MRSSVQGRPAKLYNFEAGGAVSMKETDQSVAEDYPEDFNELSVSALDTARDGPPDAESAELEADIARELREHADRLFGRDASAVTPRSDPLRGSVGLRQTTELAPARAPADRPPSVPALLDNRKALQAGPSRQQLGPGEDPLNQLKTTSKFMTAHHLAGMEPQPQPGPPSRLGSAASSQQGPPGSRARTPLVASQAEQQQPPPVARPKTPEPPASVPAPAPRAADPPARRAPAPAPRASPSPPRSLLSDSISDLAVLLNSGNPMRELQRQDPAAAAAAASLRREYERDYEKAMAELEGLLRDLQVDSEGKAPSSAPVEAKPASAARAPARPFSADDEPEPSTPSPSAPAPHRAAPRPASTVYVTEDLMRIQHHPPGSSGGAPLSLGPIPESPMGSEPSSSRVSGSVLVDQIDLAETDPWLFKHKYEKARIVAEEIAMRRQKEKELEETVRRIRELEARIDAGDASDELDDEEPTGGRGGAGAGAAAARPSPGRSDSSRRRDLDRRRSDTRRGAEGGQASGASSSSRPRVTQRASYKKLVGVAEAYLGRQGSRRALATAQVYSSSSRTASFNAGRAAEDARGAAANNVGSRSSWVS